MSRVENMFGPRERWGQGDEMAAVRERAVRQEGAKGRKHNPSVGGDPVKKNVGGGLCAAPDKHRSKAGKSPMLAHREAEMAPSVSEADSSPMLAHRGAKGSRGGGVWGGLAGFVSIRCEGCGKVVNTCLHQRTPVFQCKGCGHETSLEKVSNIHMHCARCGFTGKYRTNRTEKEIQMECLNCSDIVYLTKIRRGNYVPEAEAKE